MYSKLKKISYVVLGCCVLIFFWYVERNFNHQGEWHTLGISDIDGSSPTPLDLLGSGTLMDGDNRLLISEPRSFISGSPAVGVKIPEEIQFTWRIEGEAVSHTKKMALRSTIPLWVLRTLRQRTPVHSFRIEFFVKNKEPQFRWTLIELPKYVEGIRPNAKIIAQSPQ
jgi:hypothetical protein